MARDFNDLCKGFLPCNSRLTKQSDPSHARKSDHVVQSLFHSKNLSVSLFTHTDQRSPKAKSCLVTHRRETSVRCLNLAFVNLCAICQWLCLYFWHTNKQIFAHNRPSTPSATVHILPRLLISSFACQNICVVAGSSPNRDVNRDKLACVIVHIVAPIEQEITCFRSQIFEHKNQRTELQANHRSYSFLRNLLLEYVVVLKRTDVLAI